MSYIQAIILGMIQGLTEFLPVSSSGHLVMIQHFMDIDPHSQAMIIFDLAVHLGTMAAVLVFYRRSISRYSVSLIRGLPLLNNPVNAWKTSPGIRFSILALTAILTTFVFYKLLDKVIDQGFEKPQIVMICWLITAVVLWLTDKNRGRRIGIKQFGIGAAIIIGLAQGFALFPGISRSGSTICAAVLLGLHRRWAGEFSFLIGIPAIAGASLLEGIDFFSNNPQGLPWGPTMAGTIVSGLVGFLALQLLIWAVRKAKLTLFSIYLVIITIVTFICLINGIIG